MFWSKLENWRRGVIRVGFWNVPCGNREVRGIMSKSFSPFPSSLSPLVLSLHLPPPDDCESEGQKLMERYRFSIMDHDVLKLYSGIRNVILKVSAKQGLRGEKDAILLGSHIDSTLPAPGAADDGIGVAVMLELARVMVDRNEVFNGSAIFRE